MRNMVHGGVIRYRWGWSRCRWITVVEIYMIGLIVKMMKRRRLWWRRRVIEVRGDVS